MNTQPDHRAVAQDPNILTARAIRDRLYPVVRGGVIAIAILMTGLFVTAIPARFDQLSTVSALPQFVDPTVLLTNLDESGLSLEFFALHRVVMEASFAFLCAGLGVLIFWRRPDDRMALFTALLLILLGTTFWGTLQALTDVHPILHEVISLFDALGLMLLFVALFLFPDGRFVPRWTGWITAGLVAGVGLSMVFPASVLNPDNYPDPVFLLFLFGWLLVGAYAQIYRFRRVSGPVQRQQTKWVGFGIIAAVLGFLLLILIGDVLFQPAEPGTITEMLASTVMTLVMAVIPASISVAILRHRLFDLDSLINRALVYGALTACVIGIYILLVGYLGELLRSERSLLISLIATGVVAVAFAPLRDYLQRNVNRLMYGERDDPYRVITRLGERLEEAFAPEEVLPTVVETVREAMNLRYVAISLGGESQLTPAVASGTPVADPLRLPLVYQNERVGTLLLARRPGEDEFSGADRRLLENLVRQAGVAVHSIRLNADLQCSRQRLVTAREEERRRLRRDLHDGVGPRLAALVMKLETARGHLSHVPEADGLLDDIAEQVRDAVGDIRRAVHALRPPALDELGLIPALRESAARYSSDGFFITVECHNDLPSLPAAVEVAAYLIVQEATTNVVRHADARTCDVRIGIADSEGKLRLTVEDDGTGLGVDRSPGVGLSSMRDRAEELGGTFVIEPRVEGGTRVRAVLPYVARDLEGPGRHDDGAD